MFSKATYPAYMRDAQGNPPLAATQLAGDTQRWLGVWLAQLAIISPDETVCVHEWWEFSTASWNGEERQLVLSFVAPDQEPLRLILPEDAEERALTVIYERLERSILTQAFADLPSGDSAQGYVRRRSDDTLFIQMIVNAQPTAADVPVLKRLETELRDMAGMDYRD